MNVFSFTFIVFLFLVLACYWLLPKKKLYQNLVICIASLIFIGFVNHSFALVIFCYALAVFAAQKLISYFVNRNSSYRCLHFARYANSELEQLKKAYAADNRLTLEELNAFLHKQQKAYLSSLQHKEGTTKVSLEDKVLSPNFLELLAEKAPHLEASYQEMVALNAQLEQANPHFTNQRLQLAKKLTAYYYDLATYFQSIDIKNIAREDFDFFTQQVKAGSLVAENAGISYRELIDRVKVLSYLKENGRTSPTEKASQEAAANAATFSKNKAATSSPASGSTSSLDKVPELSQAKLKLAQEGPLFKDYAQDSYHLAHSKEGLITSNKGSASEASSTAEATVEKATLAKAEKASTKNYKEARAKKANKRQARKESRRALRAQAQAQLAAQSAKDTLVKESKKHKATTSKVRASEAPTEAQALEAQAESKHSASATRQLTIKEGGSKAPASATLSTLDSSKKTPASAKAEAKVTPKKESMEQLIERYAPNTVKGRLTLFFTRAYSLLDFPKVTNANASQLLEERDFSPFAYVSIIIASILPLTWFKYADFIQEKFLNFAHQLGFSDLGGLLYVIPVMGISFYTFNSISLLISVKRGEVKSPSLLTTLTFVTYFPTIVAGPISRATWLIPKLESDRQVGNTGEIFFNLSLGIMKKWLLATILSTYFVTPVFQSPESYNSLEIIAGVYAYAFQIYFDFSGYTDLMYAIGLCFGIRHYSNFRVPYSSVNIKDFWTRWHISLSSWIRDYIYIPLGGNRDGFLLAQCYTVIAMMLSGIWHGVTINYILWGFLHTVGILAINILNKIQPLRIQYYSKTLSRFLTFNFVCFTWIFFNADDFPVAVGLLDAIGSNFSAALALDYSLFALVALLLLFFLQPLLGIWVQRLNLKAQHSRLGLVVSVAVLFMVVVINLAPSGVPGFIYQNF